MNTLEHDKNEINPPKDSKLANLLEQGLLTKEEFTAEKQVVRQVQLP